MVTLRTHRIDTLSAAGEVAHTIGRAVIALGGKTLAGTTLAGSTLGGKTLGKRLMKGSLAARLGVGAIPLIGIGLAVWGYRAWRRQQQREPQELARKQLPLNDPKPPRDRVDESSWESFPASDPPSFSPTRAQSGANS